MREGYRTSINCVRRKNNECESFWVQLLVQMVCLKVGCDYGYIVIIR